MSKNYRIYLLIILLSATFLSKAQQTHSSPFSFIGLGDMNQSGLAYNRSLGGLGIGLRSSHYLNGINPAGLSAMDTLSFTFEFGASGVNNIVESSNSSESTLGGAIDYLAIGFPITKWLKSSIGFVPYSQVGYNLTEFVDVNDGVEDIFTLQRDIQGEGGINSFYMSNSLMLFKNLSLGFTVSYLFGQISNTTTDVPEVNNSSISTYAEQMNIQISDLGYSVGLQYHDKINEKYSYTVGGIFGMENSLNSTSTLLRRSFSIGHPAGGDTLLWENEVERDINLPTFFGLGFSITNQKLMVGVDYKNTLWSQAEIGINNETYFDAQSLIVGAEYIPKPRTATKYVHRMRYRLAGRYENSYMKIYDQQLKEVGITFGVGLPMKRSKSTMNLSLDIGRRGTFESESLSQTYFRFKIDLSFHDVWFLQRKYD